MPITSRFFIYKIFQVSYIRQYSPIFRHSEKILNTTDSALQQLTNLNQKYPEKKLRIAIEAGGCHGFQYKFSLESRTQSESEIKFESDKDDLIFSLQSPSNETQNLAIICDNVSWSMIKDAKLDYTRELIGSTFKIIDNPEVNSGCGCGVSFDLKH